MLYLFSPLLINLTSLENTTVLAEKRNWQVIECNSVYFLLSIKIAWGSHIVCLWNKQKYTFNPAEFFWQWFSLTEETNKNETKDRRALQDRIFTKSFFSICKLLRRVCKKQAIRWNHRQSLRCFLMQTHFFFICHIQFKNLGIHSFICFSVLFRIAQYGKFSIMFKYLCLG